MIGFSLDAAAVDGEARGLYPDGREVGREVLSIDLTGTMAGLEAVLECQDEPG